LRAPAREPRVYAEARARKPGKQSRRTGADEPNSPLGANPVNLELESNHRRVALIAATQSGPLEQC